MAQVIDDNAAALVAKFAPIVGGRTTDLVLDDVEQEDAPQHFRGDRRLVRQFVKLAPDVCPAEGQLDLLPTLGERGIAAISVNKRRSGTPLKSG